MNQFNFLKKARIQLLRRLVIPAEAEPAPHLMRGIQFFSGSLFSQGQAWIPVPRLKPSRTSFTGMTTWVRQQKNLFRELKGLSFLRKQESSSNSPVLMNSKGISVLFLVIAMLLMTTIGYVFSYLIPTKQKSVVFPIQSSQAFFIAQSGVEFGVRYANGNGWTTTAELDANINNLTRNLGSGRFTLTYNFATYGNRLISVGEVPIGTERRRVSVSNFTSFLMEITYFGSASFPADNGSNAVEITAVNPPVGMQAGDLVLMIAQARAGAGALNISNTGNQVWTSLAQQNAPNCRIRLFWCRFDGAWIGGNPSVDFNSTNSNTLVMHVFRPSNTSSVWEVDVAQVSANFAAPGAPFTVTIPGITTITDGALVFATWASPDDNQWGALTAGWTTPGSPQYRNTSGTDQSQTHAYWVMTIAGASGNVSKNQTTLGGDAGRRLIIAFRARVI